MRRSNPVQQGCALGPYPAVIAVIGSPQRPKQCRHIMFTNMATELGYTEVIREYRVGERYAIMVLTYRPAA